MRTPEDILAVLREEIGLLRQRCALEQEPLRERLRATESEEERWELGRRLSQIHAAYQCPIEELLAAAVSIAALIPPAPVVISSDQARKLGLIP